LWYFPFYFLGGFFMYGSLYAAIGASVDNIQDAQQLVFPITIPQLLPVLLITNIIQNPESAFAKFASMFPFFSPMIMLVRMSLIKVPWYEIVASMSFLVLGFLGSIWVAARIYEMGIFMYGKKPSFKEIWKWIRR
jgi:ABC-2 type transport system permease protein